MAWSAEQFFLTSFVRGRKILMPIDKEHGKSIMNQQRLFNATVKLTKNKLIEQVMSPQDLEDTGVGDLSKEQKAALNAFLDSNLVVAPGPKNE
jgi:hypothetical protein